MVGVEVEDRKLSDHGPSGDGPRLLLASLTKHPVPKVGPSSHPLTTTSTAVLRAVPFLVGVHHQVR